METKMGIYKITIPADADIEAFEEAMRSQVFPLVEVGKQTRAGIVTAQHLLKGESPGSEHKYSWIVRWESVGDALFGGAKTPADPAPHLAAFGAKISFVRYIVIAERPE